MASMTDTGVATNTKQHESCNHQEIESQEIEQFGKEQCGVQLFRGIFSSTFSLLAIANHQRS